MIDHPGQLVRLVAARGEGVLPDRVQVVRPGEHLGGDLLHPHQGRGQPDERVGVRRPLWTVRDPAAQHGVRLGLQRGEHAVLQLALDRLDAEPVAQRDQHVLGGAGDADPGGERAGVDGAHVVQPVGQLDDQDPDVGAGGDEHLADRLGLGGVAVEPPSRTWSRRRPAARPRRRSRPAARPSCTRCPRPCRAAGRRPGSCVSMPSSARICATASGWVMYSLAALAHLAAVIPLGRPRTPRRSNGASPSRCTCRWVRMRNSTGSSRTCRRTTDVLTRCVRSSTHRSAVWATGGVRPRSKSMVTSGRYVRGWVSPSLPTSELADRSIPLA